MQSRSRLARLSSRAVSAVIKQPQHTRPLATVVDPIQKVTTPNLVSLTHISDQSYQDPAELDEISTLPNGIRVATEALPGAFSGIGTFRNGRLTS